MARNLSKIKRQYLKKMQKVKSTYNHDIWYKVPYQPIPKYLLPKVAFEPIMKPVREYLAKQNTGFNSTDDKNANNRVIALSEIKDEPNWRFSAIIGKVTSHGKENHKSIYLMLNGVIAVSDNGKSKHIADHMWINVDDIEVYQNIDLSLSIGDMIMFTANIYEYSSHSQYNMSITKLGFNNIVIIKSGYPIMEHHGKGQVVTGLYNYPRGDNKIISFQLMYQHVLGIGYGAQLEISNESEESYSKFFMRKYEQE